MESEEDELPPVEAVRSGTEAPDGLGVSVLTICTSPVAEVDVETAGGGIAVEVCI